MLAGGKGASRLRVLDRYSARSCQYEASLRLPGLVSAIAIDESTFYFESELPAAKVVALRRR